VPLSGRVVFQGAGPDREVRLPAATPYPGLPGVDKLAINETAAPSTRFNLVEFDGGSEVPPHASPTINYWLVLEGELFSTVPGHDDVLLRTGDCCVQDDVEHGWRVPIGGRARLLAVVVGKPEG
jgi:quercetin dioxygenase-like cupin family protein